MFEKIKTIFQKEYFIGEEREINEILIPEELKGKCEAELREKKSEWILKLTEKRDQIPEKAKGKDLVLNGYFNKIEILDFPLKGKPLYIQLKRRRWKDKATETEYKNEYKIHLKNAKITPKFGDFLKDKGRKATFELFNIRKNLRHFPEKDVVLV